MTKENSLQNRPLEPHQITRHQEVCRERVIGGVIDLFLLLGIQIIGAALLFAVGFIPVVGGFINIVLSLFFGLLGVSFMLFRDLIDFGPFKGNSPGKFYRKLKVTQMDGTPITWQQSVKRNVLFAVGPLLMTLVAFMVSLVQIIPVFGAILGGTLSFIAGGLVVILTLGIFAVEAFYLYNNSESQRLGDQWAQTRVELLT